MRRCARGGAPAIRPEVSLEGEYRQLRVRGRADGYDPQSNRVEEIKTYRGDLGKMPDNHRQLHWAQAKMYGFLLCRKLALAEIHVALVYYEIGEQTETVLSELHSATDLQQFFEQQCARFLAWAEQEMQHRTARDQALRALDIPARRISRRTAGIGASGLQGGVARLLPDGASADRDRQDGRHAVPAAQGCAGQGNRQDLLSGGQDFGPPIGARCTGAHQRQGPSLPLRVLELIARDKACEYPDKACHGESCPLAQGFYDRLPDARRAILAAPMFDKATLREVALAHRICPYYLSQEMARWADVVVGDYNYYFDVSAMLHTMTANNQWRVSLLIDEAHNMVERGRKMYLGRTGSIEIEVLAQPTRRRN